MPRLLQRIQQYVTHDMICVIPIHNQSDYIYKLIEGFESQIIKPSMLFFVLDRCNDNSKEIIKSIKSDIPIDYVEKTFGKKFSAGSTRNYGVSIYKERYGFPKNVLFVDGDCVPNKYVISDHIENLNRIDAPIVSCGRRVAYNKDTVDVGDRRDSDFNNLLKISNSKGIIFHQKNGKLLHSSLYHDSFVATHSCNLALNNKAIQLCCEMNQLLYSNSKEEQIFNSRFDGIWGYEDNFVGQLMFMTKGYIFACSDKSFVEHKYHKSNTQKFNLRKNYRVFRALTSKLKLIINYKKEYTNNIININLFPNNNNNNIFCDNSQITNNSYSNLESIDVIKTNDIYDSIIDNKWFGLDYFDDEYYNNYLATFHSRNKIEEINNKKHNYKDLSNEELINQIKKILKTYITIENGIVSS